MCCHETLKFFCRHGEGAADAGDDNCRASRATPRATGALQPGGKSGDKSAPEGIARTGRFHRRDGENFHSDCSAKSLADHPESFDRIELPQATVPAMQQEAAAVLRALWRD